MSPLAIAGVIDGMIIIVMGSIGYLLVRVLRPELSIPWSLPYWFPLGSGLVTFTTFVMSLLGLPVGTPMIVLGAILLIGAAIVGSIIISRSQSAEERARAKRQETKPSAPDQWVSVGLGVILLVAAGFLSVGRSYSTWDAMAIWAVKGYGIANEGTILAAKDLGAYGLSYPLNIPILISVFRILEGDVLPGSKAIFPMFLLSLVLGTYGFLRRRGKPVNLSTISALAVCSIPIVFDHGTIGYANLPFATLLALATFQAVEGLTDLDPNHLAMSGLLYALAVWTRPEGLFFMAPVGLIVIAYILYIGQPFKRLLPWLLPIAVVAGVWIAFTAAFGLTGTYATAIRKAGAGLMRLELNLGAFYWIFRFLLRQYLRPEIWGFAAPLVVIFTSINFGKLRRNRWSHENLLLLAALGFGLSVVIFYYVMSFHVDLVYWLGTGVERMMLPATILAVTWSLTLINGEPRADANLSQLN